jgi:uncharacterized Zn-finger protein
MRTAVVSSTERSFQVWESEGGALARLSPPALIADPPRAWTLNTSRRDVRAPVAAFGSQGERAGAIAERMPTPGYPRLKNDRQFECIGESPPHDHPHIHIDMGSQDTILCPYCGTRYRLDVALSPAQADPEDSLSEDVQVESGAVAGAPLAAHPTSLYRAAPRSLRRPPRLVHREASPLLSRRTEMFGHQGGEDKATVARKREYLKDAQRKWPFLTNLDASTIHGEGQLIDLVKTRKSLSDEQAGRDVRAWMQGKQF